MLLGLTGLKGSGKDVVGAYLVKEHGFERRSFADKLKESAAALFDVEAWEFDEWKNDPAMVVGIGQPSSEYDNSIDTLPPTLSVRNFLQRYGTEAHRDIFGRDFWVDNVLPVGGFYAGRAIVVTDVRFRNEMERIQLVGGHVIYVDRPALDQKDPHSSEQEVGYGADVGYHLMNDSTIDELYDNIERMLEELG
jgi:hypothetical protein